MTSEFPIALKPSAVRDHCRLLVVDRSKQNIAYRRFADILEYFRPGDCLVVNASKVFGARIPFWVEGRRGDLLLGALPKNGEAVGAKIEGRFGRLLKRSGGRVRFRDESEGHISIGAFDEVSGAMLAEIQTASPLESLGEIPLPPYIVKARKAAGLPELETADAERYQCVYAEIPGSAACPTAGLHWTKELLAQLEANGALIAKIVLHVGFASMVHGVGRAQVPPEEVLIEESQAELINTARSRGGRIFACGTSTVRALESAMATEGRIRPLAGPAELFIRPGHHFRAAHAMITNFHLPESTNFLMTQAFLSANRDLGQIYSDAVSQGYQFYSYGDAMLIE